jgi:hypothetical protein
MMRSSLAKQSAIGRAFELAAQGSPEYKQAVFQAYAQQRPELIHESGATDYDSLMHAAYAKMAKETDDQFHSLPVKFSFHRNGEGDYPNSGAMLDDLHRNGHLFVFQGGDPHTHLSAVDPRTGLNANEKFRAVHDAYGHGILGNTFGPQGEERAWGIHSQMYSPLARLAMSAETRGQNSYVNYSPLNAELKEHIHKLEMRHAEARRAGRHEEVSHLKAAKREALKSFKFAPQVGGLLPPEMIRHDYAGHMPEYVRRIQHIDPSEAIESDLTHFSPHRGLQELDPSKYGTGLKGDERSRVKGGQNSMKDRTYYYLGQHGNVTPEPGVGSNAYSAHSNRLYDLSKDPHGLFRLANESNRESPLGNFNPGVVDHGQATNDVERMAYERGYAGVANPKAQYPMAALFEKLPLHRASGGEASLKDIGRYVQDPNNTKSAAVYGNPREIAAASARQVAPENPYMKKLFGVTRDDLFQIGQHGQRKGNEEPNVDTSGKANINTAKITNPKNAGRRRDLIDEGKKHEGLLKSMTSWYVMDPMYQHLVKLLGPDEAKRRYDEINTYTGLMSPQSRVDHEINRGLGALYLQHQGRFDDFQNYGGVRKDDRGPDYPQDMRHIVGHKNHKSSHASVLSRYIADPENFKMQSAKVPLYIQSSGVPETGFQTRYPVTDKHLTVLAGMRNARKNGDDAAMNNTEYRSFGPWFEKEVANKSDLQGVPAHGLLWGTGASATGVRSKIGASKLEMFVDHIMKTAKRLGISPEDARDRVLTGKTFADGGMANADQPPEVSQAIQQARQLTPSGFYSQGAEAAQGLSRPKGTVGQMRSMLAGQGVKKEEMTHSGVNAIDPGTKTTSSDLANHFSRAIPEIEEHLKVGDSLSRNPTLYSDYSMPGGNNYRELLLKLKDPTKNFTHPHWPHQQNPLVHLRMKDRVDEDGKKVLHLDELQSDWGQQGREKGFQKTEPQRFYVVNTASGNRGPNFPSKQAAEAYWSSLPENIRRQSRVGTTPPKVTGEIPSAPFVTDTKQWTDLGLKRALVEAARTGADRLAWTPGAEHIKRFDIGDLVDRIEYQPHPTNPENSKFKAFGHEGEIIHSGHYAPEKLSELIGKEAAEKLLATKPKTKHYYPADSFGTELGDHGYWTPEEAHEAGNNHVRSHAFHQIIDYNSTPTHVISGDGLTMGGEGMKGYYDKIVPDRLLSLAKKLDSEAKLGKSWVPGADKYVAKAITHVDADRPRHVVYHPDHGEVAQHADRYGAMQDAEQRNFKELPHLEITPKMRESILKGLPIFKRGGEVGAYAKGGSVVGKAMRVARDYGGGIDTVDDYGRVIENAEMPTMDETLSELSRPNVKIDRRVYPETPSGDHASFSDNWGFFPKSNNVEDRRGENYADYGMAQGGKIEKAVRVARKARAGGGFNLADYLSKWGATGSRFDKGSVDSSSSGYTLSPKVSGVAPYVAPYVAPAAPVAPTPIVTTGGGGTSGTQGGGNGHPATGDGGNGATVDPSQQGMPAPTVDISSAPASDANTGTADPVVGGADSPSAPVSGGISTGTSSGFVPTPPNNPPAGLRQPAIDPSTDPAIASVAYGNNFTAPSINNGGVAPVSTGTGNPASPTNSFNQNPSGTVAPSDPTGGATVAGYTQPTQNYGVVAPSIGNTSPFGLAVTSPDNSGISPSQMASDPQGVFGSVYGNTGNSPVSSDEGPNPASVAGTSSSGPVGIMGGPSISAPDPSTPTAYGNIGTSMAAVDTSSPSVQSNPTGQVGMSLGDAMSAAQDAQTSASSPTSSMAPSTANEAVAATAASMGDSGVQGDPGGSVGNVGEGNAGGGEGDAGGGEGSAGGGDGGDGSGDKRGGFVDHALRKARAFGGGSDLSAVLAAMRAKTAAGSARLSALAPGGNRGGEGDNSRTSAQSSNPSPSYQLAVARQPQQDPEAATPQLRAAADAGSSADGIGTTLKGLVPGWSDKAPAPRPQGQPQSRPQGQPQGQPAASGDRGSVLDSLMGNISNKIESGGNYKALGPVTKSGDRAYGAYQVMGSNIPQWTQRWLGKSMTPEQFLASPEAQDAVARGQLGSYLDKYGNPQDAASMWFSGRPAAQSSNLRDQIGTSGSQYVRTATQGLPQQAQPQSTSGDIPIPNGHAIRNGIVIDQATGQPLTDEQIQQSLPNTHGNQDTSTWYKGGYGPKGVNTSDAGEIDPTAARRGGSIRRAPLASSKKQAIPMPVKRGGIVDHALAMTRRGAR